MNERRLRSMLREAPLPETAQAERRGLEVLEAAFAERQPHEPQVSVPRLALALAAALLLGALLLSPAGAAVRDWVDDVFTANTPKPEPGLAEIPGGGRLLVQSQAGPWVVQPDGSRRLLGDYEEATWSPRGLYVAVAAGGTLSALEPDGTPRWSLDSGAQVADPRWSPSGVRIAYRSGRGLRVTVANGTGDRLIDASVAPVAPVWSPLGLHHLAYVDADGTLRVVDADSGAELAAAPALPDVRALDWGTSGALLEAGRSSLRVRVASIDKLAQAIALSAPVALDIPRGAIVRDVEIGPGGKVSAALVETRRGGEPHSEVLLVPAGGGFHRLLGVPGRLGELAFSPGDGRLLVSWPQADQWLFLPVDRGRPRALGGISAAFAPGARSSAAFPRVEGWCCPAALGPPG